MEIETIKITDIKPAEYNPRTINEDELLKLKNSISTFGLVDPIIINLKNNKIIGGHQRYEVLINEYMLDNTFFKELNLIRLGDVGWVFSETDLTIPDEDHEKGLNLALNKISGEWDENKLRDLLDELNQNEFNLNLTGFENFELTEFKLIDDLDFDTEISEDNYIDVPSKEEESIICPYCDKEIIL